MSIQKMEVCQLRPNFHVLRSVDGGVAIASGGDRQKSLSKPGFLTELAP
ncbi:hypothetical protein [Oscillatoria acuminata]|nr:hypothetical protein [Oscillatoria acuminata]